MKRCIVTVVCAVGVSGGLGASARAADIREPRHAAIYLEAKRDGRSSATATVIEHRQQWYVVTAYHALYGSSSAFLMFGLSRDDSGVLAAKDSRTIVAHPTESLAIAENIIYDRRFDIAALKLNAAGKQALQNQGVIPLSPFTLPRGAVEGAAGQPVVENPPVGTSAISIGSPEIEIDTKKYRVPNVVYECLVSDYNTVGQRIPGALALELSGDRQTVVRRTTQLMFLETLSIAPGFSGGPIVSAEGQLLGIVIGGVESPSVQAGRFAWACPVKELVRVLDQAGANADTDGGKFTYPNTRWAPPPAPEKGDELFPMYKRGSKYSDSDKQTITEPAVFTAPRLDDLLKDPSANAYEFRKVKFIDIDFAGRRLINWSFIECDFTNCNFDLAVLSGATFNTCTLTPPRTHHPLLVHGAFLDIAPPALANRPATPFFVRDPSEANDVQRRSSLGPFADIEHLLRPIKEKEAR